MISEINKAIEKYSLLKHPFYRKWSEGKLDKEELKGYAKEYYHLVKAVPVMVETLYNSCPNPAIKQNLQDEKSHIQLWEKFAEGMGISPVELQDYIPSSLTVRAVNKMLSLMENPREGIAAMYAFELEIPRISRIKMEGLKAFYGMAEPDTLEYFTEHEVADIHHTKVWSDLIKDFNDADSRLALLSATASLKAQNQLLDAVCDRYMIEYTC